VVGTGPLNETSACGPVPFGTGLGLLCLRHFQQYFSYIVAVSFIDGGNRITGRKITDLPKVTDKLYHIKLCQLHLSISSI